MKIVSVCLLAASLCLSGIGFAEPVITPVKPDCPIKKTATEPTYGLFALMAKEGHLQAIAGAPNSFKLTLNNVDTKLIFFTNRPKRQAKRIELATLVDKWNELKFNQDPPNAVIEGVNPFNQGKQQSQAILLTKPHFDNKTNQLTFIVQPLHKPKHPIQHHQLKDIALFIDNTCWSCM